MAKEKTQVSGNFPAFVDVADIAWLPSRNSRKVYGSDKEMEQVDQALWNGWAQAYPCELTTLDAEAKAEEMSKRQARWEFHQSVAKSNADGAARLKVFEMLYVKDGKLREPKYLGNTGNRRGSRIEEIGYKRLKEKQEPWTQVAVYFKEHASEASRRESQLFENFGRDNAAKNLSGKEIMAATQLLYEVGYKESDLMRTGLKRGMAQKVHRLFQLNSKFPDVKILERLQLDETDDRFIPWGIDKEEIKSLLDCIDPTEAGKKQKPITTLSVVEEYFAALRKGERPEKAMNKDDFLELGQQSNIQLVKDVVEAYRTNDKDTLFRHAEATEAHNLVTECHRLGKLQDAIKALRALTVQQ